MSVAQQSAAHIHSSYCRPGQSNPNTSRAQSTAIGNDAFQQDTYISRTKWTPLSKNPNMVYFLRHLIYVEPAPVTYFGVPSVDTVSISDFALTRALSSIRTPSTDSSTVADASIIGTKTPATGQFNRVPGTETITVTDSSLSRLLQLVRGPSTDTISVSETSITGTKTVPGSSNLFVEKGTFTKTTTTGVSNQTVNLVDTTLTPKLLILWTNGLTTNDGSYAENMIWSYGFSDGTNDICEAISGTDNATTQNEGYVFNDANIIQLLSAASSTLARANVASFNAGNFVLNWTTQTDTNAIVFHYIVAGGSDITNVSVVSTTVGDTATGNHSYSGTGTSFTPDVALTITGTGGTSIKNSLSTGVDYAQLNIGAARTTGEQFCMSGRTETVGTSDTDMNLHNDACLLSLNITTGAQLLVANFVSFDNAAGGGITVNVTSAAGDSGDLLGFLFVKGGSWNVGSFQQRSGTGTQNITLTDSSLDPSIVFLAGVNTTTANTSVVNNYLGIGASDGTNEGCSWVGDMDAQALMTNTRSNSNTKVYRQATPAVTASSSTTDAECDMSDMATAGQFTLNWTTADTTQRQMGFWTVGSPPTTGTSYTGTPSTDTTSISDASLTTAFVRSRIPSLDSSTIVDSSLTRMKSAYRVPSTDTATIVDSSLVRSKSQAFAPSTDSSTVTDSSLTRLLSSVRNPGTDTVTVTAGTSTRLLSASRTPSLDTVATTESLIGGRVFNRIAGTDTVTVVDFSLSRLFSALRVPSLDTISVVDSSLTRNTQAIRVPSLDTVVSAENLVGGRVFNRVPGLDTIAITDVSVTRLLSLIRIPSVDTIVSSDASVTRMRSLLRIPTLDTITFGESIASLKSVGTTDYVRNPSTDTITVVDSALTRLLSAIRTSGIDTVASAESRARMLSAIRVPSADSTTVVDAAPPSRIRSLTRILSADVATVTDFSLTRLLSATRAPTTDAVTISDASLTRLLSAMRVVTTDVITLSENIVKSQTQSLVRSPSTDITAITDGTLVRLLSASRVPTLDTVAIIDSSLTRMLQLARIVSTDTIAISDSVARSLTTAGVFGRGVSDIVTIAEASLVRLLSSVRSPTTDVSVISESLLKSATRNRIPATDTVVVTAGTITRLRSVNRLPSQDTANILEASLIRLLSLARSATDTVVITEVQKEIAHSRALLETVSITEPLLKRVVSAARSASDIVNIDEQVFYQTWHRFVFDEVVISEQLFRERQALSGSVTYATPAEVRPLLGNLGAQRTDEQIELAIDAAYDEINTKTNRIPPNDWKDTDHNFGVVKKLARYIAAREMAIGIKDFDTKPLDVEIEKLFAGLLQYDTTSDATQDVVLSSSDETYALNPSGVIWSTRYPNLKKNPSGGEGDTSFD